MTRTGRAKLVANPESLNELYDLERDPDEQGLRHVAQRLRRHLPPGDLAVARMALGVSAMPRRPGDWQSGQPSLADVAARAGVSTQTVSRVVNGTGSVTARTRHKVEQVLAELGGVRGAA
jgi:AraC-like DNA-binding protein